MTDSPSPQRDVVLSLSGDETLQEKDLRERATRSEEKNDANSQLSSRSAERKRITDFAHENTPSNEENGAKAKYSEETAKNGDGNPSTNIQRSASKLDVWKFVYRSKVLPDDPKYHNAAKKVWEIFFYILFLVNLSCVSLMVQDSQSAFYFNDSIKDAFSRNEFQPDSSSSVVTQFESIKSVHDFWNYMETVFLPTILTTGTQADDGFHYVLGTNILIGEITMRQLRLRKDIPCNLPSGFKSNKCVYAPSYDVDYELKDDYVVGDRRFPYIPGTVTYASLYTGKLDNYASGGFFATISHNISEAITEIKELESIGWIDDYTRAVFMDFTLFNPPSNMFLVNRMMLEQSRYGSIYTFSYTRSVTFFRMHFTSDLVLLGFEGLLFLFIAYYTMTEFRQMRKRGFKIYIRDPWSMLDCISLVIFYLQFSLEIFTFIQVDKKLTNLPETGGFNFFDMAFTQEQIKMLIAINTVVCYFRMFKYVSIDKRMSELTRTLSFARRDLFYFLIMFMLVFWGFMQAFHISFGPSVTRFSTLRFTSYSLFTSILGEVSLGEIIDTNQLLGPILFFTFIGLVFFVLLNMFLAILNQSYEHIRKFPPEDDQDLILQEYIRRKYAELKRKLIPKFLAVEPTVIRLQPKGSNIDLTLRRRRRNRRQVNEASEMSPSQSLEVVHEEQHDSIQTNLRKAAKRSKHSTINVRAAPSISTDDRSAVPADGSVNATSANGTTLAAADMQKIDRLLEMLEGNLKLTETTHSVSNTGDALERIDVKFGRLYEKLEDLILILLEQNSNNGRNGGDDENDGDDYM